MNRKITFLLIFLAGFALSGQNNLAKEVKEIEKLSAIQTEVLYFWSEAVPIELVRLHRQFLPKTLNLPDAMAITKDSTLLKFYSTWAPKSLTAMIGRLSQFRYPIIDTQDLKNQLKISGGRISDADLMIVSNLRLTDFPIMTLKHALDIAAIRAASAGFKGCWDAYNDCRGESGTAAARCERQYEACADAWSIGVFIEFYNKIIKRPKIPIPPPVIR